MAASDSDDDIFPAAYREAQGQQARGLMPAAAKAGLKFDAYLAPRDACLALEAIAEGAFISPAELVAVAVQEFFEMAKHADLRQELLRRSLQEALDDPRPSIPADQVFAELEAVRAKHSQHQPAQLVHRLPDQA